MVPNIIINVAATHVKGTTNTVLYNVPVAQQDRATAF